MSLTPKQIDKLVAEQITKVAPTKTAIATKDGGKSAALYEDWGISERDVREFVKEHPEYSLDYWYDYPNYSTNLASAWQVLEKLRTNDPYLQFELRFDSSLISSLYTCFIRYKVNIGSYSSESAPETICLAAIRAVGIDLYELETEKEGAQT